MAWPYRQGIQFGRAQRLTFPTPGSPVGFLLIFKQQILGVAFKNCRVGRAGAALISYGSSIIVMAVRHGHHVLELSCGRPQIIHSSQNCIATLESTEMSSNHQKSLRLCGISVLPTNTINNKSIVISLIN